MVATHILKQELWQQMEALEATLGELEGVDPDTVAAVAKRAGNSSEGKPPRPRPADSIGVARYFTDLLRIVVEDLAEKERRISMLEGREK